MEDVVQIEIVVYSTYKFFRIFCHVLECDIFCKKCVHSRQCNATQLYLISQV